MVPTMANANARSTAMGTVIDDDPVVLIKRIDAVSDRLLRARAELLLQHQGQLLLPLQGQLELPASRRHLHLVR